MIFDFFFQSLLIGIAVAAPIGPIGVLCIKKSLSHGALSGIRLGLGASSADAFYAAVSAFGIGVIADFFTEYKTAIQILGVVILAVMGVRTFFSKPSKAAVLQNGGKQKLYDVLAAFVLTATNPVTLVAFTTLFLSIGLDGRSSLNSLAAVFGVFVGSMACWVTVSMLTTKFHGKITDAILVKINRFFGILILLFALALMFRL